jgi:WD40-like Beta Propeller Repeat
MILGKLVLTRLTLRASIIISALAILTVQAWADAEIVIAIRYLQAEGTSHSHLYLYREEGKLLRQLTKDNSGQDSGPIFAPDGATIVFTREKPGNVGEFWSIDPRGAGLKKLEAAPDWYIQAKSSPYFTNVEPEESASPGSTASSEESASPGETPPSSYKSPDGSVELILREDPKDEDDQIDGPGHGKHYLLRDLKTGAETEFEKLPGFYGVFGLLHDTQDKDQHFLFDGPLRLAFFDLHLNSTDGDTVFALHLTGPRLVRLSPNWAAPIPLPGEAAFLTFTENRYVPIPGSKKTANCSYMERWDEKLNKIRYAREKSAALCYGASMYRPGLTPSTITLRRSSN